GRDRVRTLRDDGAHSLNPPSKYRDVADVLGHGSQGYDARTERTSDAGISTAADTRRIFDVVVGIHLVRIADLEDRYLRADRRRHGSPRPCLPQHIPAVPPPPPP